MPDTPQTAEQTQRTRENDAGILRAERLSDADMLAVARHQRINLIWEYTQAFIAWACVIVALGSSLYLIFTGTEPLAERAYQFVTNIGLLVIGFYFGRTNHTRPTGALD